MGRPEGRKYVPISVDLGKREGVGWPFSTVCATPISSKVWVLSWNFQSLMKSPFAMISAVSLFEPMDSHEAYQM